MKRVLLLSGGLGSWETGKRIVAQHGTDNLVLLFADTLYEDADTYRFLIEGAANILGRRLNWPVPAADDFPDYRAPRGVSIADYRGNPQFRAYLADLRERAQHAMPELVWLADGRDPWEVYRDNRFLGNSRVDPCSKVLKREVSAQWLAANCDKAAAVCYVGIDWTEKHRFDDGEGGGVGSRNAAAGWTYEAPLCEPPFLWRGDIFHHLAAEGIERPRLYASGYSHGNCGGFCCKGGHAHWRNRYRAQPDRFAYDALMEQRMRRFLGRPVTMLTDRAGGGRKPLSLRQLQARIDGDPAAAEAWDDYGACGCYSGVVVA